MSIRKETTGDVLACDGCGRVDAGPGNELYVAEYTVLDPNTGTATIMHFDPHCASQRGLIAPAAVIPGWAPSPANVVDS